MLKLGFIGCGGINRHHARTIEGKVEDIQIAAAADIAPEAVKEFGEEHPDCVLFEDYREMLSAADIEAVSVGLPTGLHAEATIAAAQAGKHVFCEKPMAMSLDDADRMIEASDAAGVKLMIGHVRRYDSDWGTFKSLVDSGVIGRPVLWRETSGGAGPGRWFMDAEMGGGPFLDGAVHNWDFANYVFGTPNEALGSIMRFGSTTALDTGAVVVRYESGDEVMLSWSWALPSGTSANRVGDVLGPKGVIRFPGTFDAGDYGEIDQDKNGAYLVDTGEEKRLELFAKRDMFAVEWEDFRDAVQEDRAPEATGAIGRAALAVGLAVLETGQTRKPVQIPV